MEDGAAERWVRIEDLARELYGEGPGAELVAVLRNLEVGGDPGEGVRLHQAAALLIAYADSVVDPTGADAPLVVLRRFLERADLAAVLPAVHLLPFYPWDTDRGFSVMDHREVAAENGTWEDVAALGRDVALMFDFVANHASIENPWVQGALLARHLDPGDPRREEVARFEGFVLAFGEDELPAGEELAALSRPRAAPVLTPYCVGTDAGGRAVARLGTRADPANADLEVLGEGRVWTTFSRGSDASGREATRQVDLDFSNPRVLAEALDVLVGYVRRGARLLRLDAVGYLWKRLGSASLHEPETHRVLVLVKAFLEAVAPGVLTIAEVNEPQDRVLPYLGSDAEPESDLVYQFTHFPLAVHAVLTGNPSFYRSWLASLGPARGRQLVTVLGSHDGMGMKPARGILPEGELDAFVTRLVEEHGGLPNHAVLPGGRRIVYEVCGTPWCLVNGEGADDELAHARYRAVVALGLLPRGLPAFYVNGVLGIENHHPPGGLDENRSVNRERLDAARLDRALADPGSREARVLAGLRALLEARAALPGFHPAAPALEVLDLGELPVVAAWLPAPAGGERLLALVEVAGREHELVLDASASPRWRDVLAGETLEADGRRLRVELPRFGVRWLLPAPRAVG